MATLQIHIDDTLKNEADALFSSLGMLLLKMTGYHFLCSIKESRIR